MGCLSEDTMLLGSSSKHQQSPLGKGNRSLKLSSYAAYESQTKILSRGIVLVWNHTIFAPSIDEYCVDN